MLNLTSQIALFVILVILFIQDLRKREVSIYLMFSALIMAVALFFSGSSVALIDIGLNVFFIVLQVLFLMAYLFITRRNPSSLLNGYLGIGDILFWLIPALYFQFLEFLLFSLLCYVLIVIGYGTLYTIKSKSTTIPLAGLMALFMAIYMVIGRDNNALISGYVYSILNI